MNQYNALTRDWLIKRKPTQHWSDIDHESFRIPEPGDHIAMEDYPDEVIVVDRVEHGTVIGIDGTVWSLAQDFIFYPILI